MESLNKDILPLIALNLKFKDIFCFSISCKNHYKYIWENNDFWRNKFYRTFPRALHFKSKHWRELFSKRLQCKYIFKRGIHAGERCNNLIAYQKTKESLLYCEFCLKKRK